MKYYYRLALCLCLVSLMTPAAGQAPAGAGIPELKEELAQWQEKIKDIQQKIKKQEAETGRGKKAFGEYQKRDAQYRSGLAAQVDSLRKDQQLLKKETDSLSAHTNGLQQSGKNLDLRQEKLRTVLISFCEKLKKLIGELPPSNIHGQVSAIEFLHGELETKTVSESEALERIWQVLKTLTDASQSMDVYAGAPPTADFKGQAHFIRMGFAYLAAVEENGLSGALWIVDENHTGGGWEPVKNKSDLAALWEAVQIHQRKAVPKLVSLPFNHEIALDSLEELQSQGNGE